MDEYVKINISDLKKIISKLNVAIEKSKFNPKAGWIELETIDYKLYIKVANFDYYIEVYIPFDCDSYSNINRIHATITSDTFIPLISKLDDDYVVFKMAQNNLILCTSSSEYTFPIIKEMGKVKSIDSIPFNCEYISTRLLSSDLISVFQSNVKGLLDSVFSKEIQQYIYVDNIGAITFTENIYINNFSDKANKDFKFLLNATQAKLFKFFDGFDLINIDVEINQEYSSAYKVRFSSESNNIYFTMVFIVQPKQMCDKFPSIKLRKLADSVSDTHIFIDKKKFEKALQRLMVFDKKWDITDMTYSKIEFYENMLKLVSIKNKNYEILDYDSYENSINHESIIRFADLLNQLKAIQGKTLDISYGDSPAIVINSGNLKQLIPEIQAIRRV